MSKVSCLLAACVLLLAGMALPAAAQTTSSQVSGTVIDPSSAVIPGAKVTLLNEETSNARTVATNDAGMFVFPAVVPGPYRLRVEAAGFKAIDQQGIVITANEKRSLGFIALAVGSITDSVTVEAQATQIQTSSAETSSLLASSQLAYLSTRGRDVLSLLRVLPGVTPATDSESLGGTFGTYLPAMNGQSAGFNQVTLDGQSGTDNDITNAFNQTTSMDAIAEVKVLMNTYQAEYGRNGSAVVNIISKSGSRDFHGSAYWFKRHEQFNANNFFNNRNNLPKPLYRHNIFGGTIGGPIFIPGKFNADRSKLFFFYSREDLRTFTPQNPGQLTMPSELERNGDFSKTLDVSGKLIPIKDPTTGQQFPNNVIPPARINRNGQALLNIFKLPNFFDRTISGGNYNYQWQQTSEVPKKQNLLKVDYHPSLRDRISVRGRTWWADTRQYNIFGFFMSNWDLLRYHYLFTEDSLEGTWTRSYAKVVNEFAVSYRYLHEGAPKRSANEWDPVTRSTTGLSTLGQWYPNGNTFGLIPTLSFGGVPNAANVGPEALNRVPIDAMDYRTTVLDNFSIVRGQHAFKFGIYYEFNIGSEGPRGNVMGRFTFDKDTNNALDSNYAYSNALLGNFTSYTESTAKTEAKNHLTLWEWFAQDQWRVNRKLTLELGLRFSIATPWSFPDGDASAFFPSLYDPAKAPPFFVPAFDAQGKRVGKNPITGQLVPAVTIGFYVPGSGDPINGMKSAADRAGKSFNPGSGLRLGPRFGFAYDVFGDGKTALRGGFSITRNPIPSNGRWSNYVNIAPPTQYNPTLYYGNLDTFASAAGLLSPPASIAAYDPQFKSPAIYSWSLSIQRDLGKSMLASVAYVGNVGRHLMQQAAINTLPYGARFLAANADPTRPGYPLPDNFLRPYRGYGSINYVTGNGNSNYNALQTSLNRRFTRGYQFSLGYTWSKAMADGGSIPIYLPIHSWTYGKTGDDRTHVFTVNFTYDIPKLSKLLPNPFVRQVFDDWQLSGIGTFASGSPSGISFSTTTGADLTGGGDGQRVNILGPIVIADPSFSRWFNTENVAVPGKGDIGNAAPDLFRGPGTNNWDLTIFKNIRVKDRATFQLRWEAYNVFNHTQWSGVNSAARFDASGKQVNSLFGTVTSARSARVMQGSLRFQF